MCRRGITSTLHIERSLLNRDDFIEVKDEVGGGGVGGVGDGVDGFVAFAVADHQEFFGFFGVGFEVLLEVVAVLF
jgi:hypothetical protein